MTTATAVYSPDEAVAAHHDAKAKSHALSVAFATKHINEALMNSKGSAEFDVMNGSLIRWSGGMDGSLLPVRVVSIEAAIDALKASNRSYKLETKWLWYYFLGLVPVWPCRIQVLHVNC